AQSALRLCSRRTISNDNPAATGQANTFGRPTEATRANLPGTRPGPPDVPGLCGEATVAVGLNGLTVPRPWRWKRRKAEKIFALPLSFTENGRTFPKGREKGVLSHRRSGVAAVRAVLEGPGGNRCPFPRSSLLSPATGTSNNRSGQAWPSNATLMTRNI